MLPSLQALTLNKPDDLDRPSTEVGVVLNNPLDYIVVRDGKKSPDLIKHVTGVAYRQILDVAQKQIPIDVCILANRIINNDLGRLYEKTLQDAKFLIKNDNFGPQPDNDPSKYDLSWWQPAKEVNMSNLSEAFVSNTEIDIPLVGKLQIWTILTLDSSEEENRDVKLTIKTKLGSEPPSPKEFKRTVKNYKEAFEAEIKTVLLRRTSEEKIPDADLQPVTEEERGALVIRSAKEINNPPPPRYGGPAYRGMEPPAGGPSRGPVPRALGTPAGPPPGFHSLGAPASLGMLGGSRTIGSLGAMSYERPRGAYKVSLQTKQQETEVLNKMNADEIMRYLSIQVDAEIAKHIDNAVDDAGSKRPRPA